MSCDNNEANDDLYFDFDTSKFREEEEITRGCGPIPDGLYHAVVNAVEQDPSGQNPAIKLTFMLLAGTVPNQTYRRLSERLFLTEKGKHRVLLFANRLGLLGKPELGQPNVRKNWGETIGKQVIIEVANREYEYKDGSKHKVSNLAFFGIWKLDDPNVAQVPRASAVALEQAAIPATTGQGTAFTVGGST
jgi:hypothetical protein